MPELPRADERTDRCETCSMWFIHRFEYQADIGDPGVVQVTRLECRANAPTVNGRGVAQWPAVEPTDWCGKWQAKDKAAWMAHVVAEDRRVKGK